MAYQAGYQYGYGDADTGFTFSPTAQGADTPIVDEKIPYRMRDPLWRHYDMPTQIHILYTSGVGAAKSRPTPDDMSAANRGSGKGDRMVYPSPGGPFNVTATEAQTIYDDGTYADALGGGVG